MHSDDYGVCDNCGMSPCVCGKPLERSNEGECPVCTAVNCEQHLAAMGGGLLNGIPEADLAALKAIVDKIMAVELTDEQKQDLKDGNVLMANTGGETEYVKVELTDDEKKELRDRMDELEDADEKELEAPKEDGAWELPPAMKIAGGGKPKAPPIQISGTKVPYSDYDDDTVGGRYKVNDWLTHIATEEIVDTDGKPRSLVVLRPEPNAARLAPAMAMAKDLVPRLRRQLMLAFEAEARISRERSQKSGKIDAGKAAQLITDGKADIFYKKSDAKDIKTAVSIVIDDSSSMQETPNRGVTVTRTGVRMAGNELLFSKNGTSMVMALALGEVCNQMGIPFEVLSYQGQSYFCNGHYTILYKTFNEPWAGSCERMGNYRCDASEDIPYEAASFAVNRLCSRTESRRIMFFLTDGNDCNHGIVKMADFAEEADDKAGIKVVGIGVLSNGLKKHMGKRAETVKVLEDLTDVVFSKLAKIIHPH